MELSSNPIQNSTSPGQVAGMGGMPSANNAVADMRVDQINNLPQAQKSVINNPSDLLQTNSLGRIGGLPAMPSANNAVANKGVDQWVHLSQPKESFSRRSSDLVSQMGNRLKNIASKLSGGDPLKGFANGLGSDLSGGVVDSSSVLSTMANLQTALSQASGSTGAIINSPNLQPVV